MSTQNHTQSGKLKIGLLVNGPQVDAYVHDLVAWAASQPDLEITHYLVLDPGQAPSGKGRWRRLADEVAGKGLWATLRRRIQGNLFKFLQRTEARSLRRSGIHNELFERHDLAPLVPQSLTLKPRVSPSGFVYRFDDADIERVRAQGFDVLLRFCDCILKGGILDSARHGIISFHHGDNRVNRGGPAAFWEVYYRQPVTGFIIQRLSEELDGGEVLFRGWAQTQTGWLLNQAHLYTISYYYLRGLLKSIAEQGGARARETNRPYSHRLYRAPGSAQILRYLGRKYRRSVVSRGRGLLKHQPRWGVAFLPGSWREAVLHRGTVIEPPPGHFIADPFLVQRDGRDYVFVEDLDFSDNRGIITVYELREGRAERLGVALAEDFHLSFPYLFEYQGELYMCPETSEARDIRLYRCLDFPLSWEPAGVLFNEVGATDTMIFEHAERWWLFTNVDAARAGDYSYELTIYHAEDPVRGPWHPHPANPIYVDPRRARNGGLLRDGGELYRVNQKQGLGVYGRAAGINRITELTTERFREERVCDIEPEFLPGIHAAHHLHSNGRYTVFDFCRWENPRRRMAAEQGKVATPARRQAGQKQQA